MEHEEVLNIEDNERFASVQKVLIWVLVANLAVTLIKIVVGMVTGVLAVVADGFHSMVDSSSNLIGLAAIRLARRPADDRHPYGYQRFETLGALSIGMLMLVAAWEIASAIIERISQGGAPEINSLTFGLVLFTFPVNLIVVILEKRAGNRLHSEILLADAKHTQTDLYVTGSVMLSVIGIWLGITWLDQVVAAVVVLLILRAAFGILRDSSRWLADSVVVDSEGIADVANGVPGVLFVHRIRSRGTPDAAFVDLHVKVSPGMSTARAHAVASEVERRLVKNISQVREALVHIEPVKKVQPSLWERMAEDIRRLAEGMGIGMHDLHIHTDLDEGYVVEIHLEFSDQVSLRQAHDLAEKFEQEVQRYWPDIKDIITHLEPVPRQVLGLENDINSPNEQRIRQVIGKYINIDQVRSLRLYQTGDHLHANLELMLPGEKLLTEAHSLAEDIELGLRTQVPALSHVIVHLEPESE
ncbi:MAG: cation diffusion facilitator family transporter [Anaerolineales bacterium]